MPYSWTTPPTFNTVDVLDEDDMNNYASGNIGYIYQELPTRARMWHSRSTVTAGNAITAAVLTTERHNLTAAQSAPSSGNKFTQSCQLAAGTYTFYTLGYTGNNCGILKWTVDGTVITSTQDWYSVGAVLNVVQSVASVVIATGGYVSILGEVNGKNASSSNYYLPLTKFWFNPAAD